MEDQRYNEELFFKFTVRAFVVLRCRRTGLDASRERLHIVVFQAHSKIAKQIAQCCWSGAFQISSHSWAVLLFSGAFQVGWFQDVAQGSVSSALHISTQQWIRHALVLLPIVRFVTRCATLVTQRFRSLPQFTVDALHCRFSMRSNYCSRTQRLFELM